MALKDSIMLHYTAPYFINSRTNNRLPIRITEIHSKCLELSCHLRTVLNSEIIILTEIWTRLGLNQNRPR